MRIATQYASLYDSPAHKVMNGRPKTVNPDTISAIIIYCKRPTLINNSVSCSCDASFTTIPVIFGVNTPEIDVDKFITILLNVPPTL